MKTGCPARQHSSCRKREMVNSKEHTRYEILPVMFMTHTCSCLLVSYEGQNRNKTNAMQRMLANKHKQYSHIFKRSHLMCIYITQKLNPHSITCTFQDNRFHRVFHAFIHAHCTADSDQILRALYSDSKVYNQHSWI